MISHSNPFFFFLAPLNPKSQSSFPRFTHISPASPNCEAVTIWSHGNTPPYSYNKVSPRPRVKVHAQSEGSTGEVQERSSETYPTDQSGSSKTRNANQMRLSILEQSQKPGVEYKWNYALHWAAIKTPVRVEGGCLGWSQARGIYCCTFWCCIEESIQRSCSYLSL